MALSLTIFYIIVAVVYTVLASVLLEGIKRKAIAHAQNRKGPSFFQGFYDFIKLLTKENLMPNVASPFLFSLAPILAFSAGLVGAMVIPLAMHNPALPLAGDLILAVYLLTLIPVAIVVGGSASGSPFGAIGAAREIAQTIAYELPLVIALIAVAVSAHTFDLATLTQKTYFFVTPLAAIACLLTIPVAVGVQPFDTPEAEQEICTGVYVEYAGPKLALMKLGVWLKGFLYTSLIVAVFFGNFVDFINIPVLNYIVHFLIVTVIMVLFVVFIRASTGRTRITNVIKMMWVVPTILASIDLVLVLLGMPYMRWFG